MGLGWGGHHHGGHGGGLPWGFVPQWYERPLPQTVYVEQPAPGEWIPGINNGVTLLGAVLLFGLLLRQR